MQLPEVPRRSLRQENQRQAAEKTKKQWQSCTAVMPGKNVVDLMQSRNINLNQDMSGCKCGIRDVLDMKGHNQLYDFG